LEVRGAALGFILGSLLLDCRSITYFSSQDGLQLPEILPAHDAAEVLFRRKRRRRPTMDYSRIPPAAHAPGPHAHARLRTLDQVDRGQALFQPQKLLQITIQNFPGLALRLKTPLPKGVAPLLA